MKPFAIHALAAAFALSLAAAAPAALAADPHHHGHGAGAPKLQLNQGKKWVTDAPLRESMAAIRETVHGAPAPLHKGTAKAADYAPVGNRVEAEVGRIVKECKLPPDADAQLHVVVADLLAGADAMKAAKDAKAGRAGLIQVDRALTAYGRHFDHPGWK
jgi:hypothetical protein